jgi:hypothetical protein
MIINKAEFYIFNVMYNILKYYSNIFEKVKQNQTIFQLEFYVYEIILENLINVS